MINSSMEFDAPGKSIVESRLGFIVNYFGNAYPIRWGAKTDYGTLSIVEAQELIEVLQAIIADYPKGPTNEEILNELPVGSVVQAYSNVNFMKAGIGWYNPMGYLYSSKRLAQEDFTVKLRGPEDGGDE